MSAGILLDLDDTLYICKPAEDAGREAVLRAIGEVAGDVRDAWAKARDAVHHRIERRGSSHARLLYLCELVHALGRPDLLPHVRTWERAYWDAFLGAARLRPRAIPFLERARASGRKIAIASDLTLAVQLEKLAHFGLFAHIDAIAISEEVPFDKPETALFELALSRIGKTASECIVVGDRPDKDGEGARRLGMPYVHVKDEDVEGAIFDEVLA